jgi:hypothetical protein
LNKLESLHFILNLNIYHIILIAETWLSKKVDDALILSHAPYKLFRCDKKGKGGGVCIILANNIPYQNFFCSKIPNSNIVAIDIIEPISFQKTRIINVYRPNTNETDKHFNIFLETLSDLCTINFPIVITGDFNMPNIRWEKNNSFTNKKIPLKEQNFLTFLNTFNLEQKIDFCTRKNNILDLVFANNEITENIISHPPFGTNLHFSDHSSIVFELKISNITPKQTSTKIDFANANFTTLNSYFSNIN